MAQDGAGAVEYGKFKVELKGVGKRVVVLPVHITLDEVHEVVQRLFDWEDAHLWEFKDGDGRIYCFCEDEYDKEEMGVIPPSDVCLSDVLPERGAKMEYRYDFGDNWRHVITRMADPSARVRHCEKTEGPDGLEDCGGPWGMQECKGEWHVPTAEEITRRLERVQLSPRKSGTGRFKRDFEAMEALIRELDDDEWEWLRQLSEGNTVLMWFESRRLETLAGLLPGARRLPEGVEEVYGVPVYKATPEFQSLWRKRCKEWAQLREGAEDPGAAAAKLPMQLRWELLNFALAAACLYGAVDAGELCELFDHWRDQKAWLKTATRETAEMGLQLVRRHMFEAGAVAYFRDGRAISTAKYPPDDAASDAALAESLELRKGKERWNPDSYNDFFCYSTGEFELPAEYEPLKRFLVEGWEGDSDDEAEADAEWMCCDVYNVFAAGRKWQAALDKVREGYNLAQLPKKELEVLVMLMAKASNATPHDANWGYSPDAMVAMQGHGNIIDLETTPFDPTGKATNLPPTIRKTVKVGRNDPCPCGSGKKFKKCCGGAQGGRS